jgi:hypothetical protein
MRLVSRLDALERRAEQSASDPDAAAVLAAGGRIGLVWTADEVRVDRAQSQPGEHVAVDLILVVDTSDEHPNVTRQMRIRERFSSDPEDAGIVYDLAGARVGRVVQVPRYGLIRWVREGDGGDDASAAG